MITVNGEKEEEEEEKCVLERKQRKHHEGNVTEVLKARKIVSAPN